MEFSPEARIAEIYKTLAGIWGPQHWWPAQSRFEVIVGAYLTQNTSWSNVELAMRKLRAAGVLSVKGIRELPVRKLQRLIRSSGYFRQKARKLKRFVSFLDQQHGGSLNRMFAQPTSVLREQLLSLNGVGPETADSILLYAGQRPVFVVDAYTKRIAARHAILAENASYEDVRQLFERSLTGCAVMPAAAMTACGPAALQPSRMSLARRSGRVQVFNEMHGLIVGVGKQYCLKARPKCEECPLRQLLPAAGLASRVGPDSPGI